MTTTTHRIKVTETPPVAHALAEARRRWPAETHESRLLARIAEDWATQRATDQRAHAAAVRDLAGRYPYPPNYLDQMRAADWPDDQYTAPEFRADR